MTPKIKICGISTEQDSAVATACGASFIGVVLAPSSPRTQTAEHAASLVAATPPSAKTVAVFVNPTEADVASCTASIVQLHGSESAETVTLLAAAAGKPLIKAFSFCPTACRTWDDHPDVAMLLVDGPAAGSGASFDHAELADLLPTLRKPLFVAGGLTPDNVASLLAIAKPYGVDVSSGVEHTRGVKDHGLIRAFCDAVKSS